MRILSGQTHRTLPMVRQATASTVPLDHLTVGSASNPEKAAIPLRMRERLELTEARQLCSNVSSCGNQKTVPEASRSVDE